VQQPTQQREQESELPDFAGSTLGHGFQEQIGQALQPAMVELREQIAATVRREVDQSRQRNGRQDEPQAQERSMERRQSEEQHSVGAEPEQPVASPRRSEQRNEPTRGEASSSRSDRRPSEDQAESQTGAIPDLGQMLQEQIGQALQPAMAEFREQMAATVRRELDEVLHQDDPDSRTGAQRATGRGQLEDQRLPQRAADQAEGEPPSKSSESEDETRSQDSESTGKHGLQGILPQLGKPLLESLPDVLEKQGEQWLRSRLDQGIDLLFSGSVRTVVRHEAERMLHVLRRVALELIPDVDTRRDLSAQADRVIETLVQDGVDQLFGKSVRNEVKEHGEQAIQALFKPDLKAALREIQAVLRLLMEALLDVLRRSWQQVLDLLLRGVVALVQNRLASVLKGTFASLSTASGEKVAKESLGARSALQEEDSDIRESMADPADQSSSREDREQITSEHRGSDDTEAAANGDEQGDRRSSRSPAGRSPSGRPPSVRQGSGRPFADRGGAGRSPRAASR